MAENSVQFRRALQCLIQMNQEQSTLDLTTATKSRTGFFRGAKRRGGFTPSVPGREHVSKQARAKVPCGRIWPNGEFGLSYHNRTNERDELPERQYQPTEDSRWSVTTGVFWHLCQSWLIARAEWEFLPWLVKSPKSAQRPETYGRRGITAYGQKVVRSGAYLLQEKYGKERLSFLTLTVPRLGWEEECKVAGRWAYLTKALLQALRRRLERAGLPKSVVLVTELQPKRLQGREPGSLHLHLVFVGRARGAGWAYRPQEYRELWLGLLSNVLGRTVPDAPCENVQRVEKDASQYLSKYLSKGVVSVAEYAEINGWNMVPRQWWSATSPIKKAVKKYTISGELAASILDQIVENWQKKGYLPNTEGVNFCRPITIKATKYQDYLIGFFGKIDKETYDDVRGLVSVLKSA